jgi:hypothetical protein
MVSQWDQVGRGHIPSCRIGAKNLEHSVDTVIVDRFVLGEQISDPLHRLVVEKVRPFLYNAVVRDEDWFFALTLERSELRRMRSYRGCARRHPAPELGQRRSGRLLTWHGDCRKTRLCGVSESGRVPIVGWSNGGGCRDELQKLRELMEGFRHLTEPGV